MAEAKPGDKICDRCNSMKATTQIIRRLPKNDTTTILQSWNVDLCTRCGTIVDNAIKRAVRPAKASKSPPPGAPDAV